MKKPFITILVILIVILGIAYYKNEQKEPITIETYSMSYNSWIGTWTGPEGTSLTVSKNGSLYDLNFVLLDGPTSTTGTPTEQGIVFNRMGQDFTLRHGTGIDTGMKWLAEKNDCLVVQQSEGYCRD